MPGGSGGGDKIRFYLVKAGESGCQDDRTVEAIKSGFVASSIQLCSMGLLRGRVIGNGAGIILSSDEPDYSGSLAQQGAEERGETRLLRAESGM